MMKQKKWASVLAVAGLAMTMQAAPKKAPAAAVENIHLTGYVGSRLDGCIEKNVMTMDADKLTAVFSKQTETRGLWATEFWGKWVQGAIASWQYNHDPQLYQKIQRSVEQMVAYQTPRGYMGDYAPEKETTNWDVWGRKYTLLGLIKWYRISGDKAALKAACRLLDYTLTQIGPEGKPIYKCGLYRGMPPSSIMEPVMFLYGETKDARYLDFAKYIAEVNETADGPQLVAKCDVPVSQRFVPGPKDGWWTFENGQKGYEMMSCYIGLLELYKVTGNEAYYNAARKAYEHIRQEEINVTGGACSLECFYGGHQKQTHPAVHTMETCVTFTWMQFAERLLQMTGESRYADDIELTMYNALMASMKADNSQFSMYVPLEGFRRKGENQCDFILNCCNANAPRAFAMIPRVTYRTPTADRIDVNLYIPSEATITLGKRQVALKQVTNYPEDGRVTIEVTPDKPMMATLALRIPGWSTATKARVNGEEVKGIKAGEYLTLSRSWQAGDRIELDMDMTAHLKELNRMVSVQRGPIVLCRDSRFDDGFVDECVSVPNKNGVVELKTGKTQPGMWMAFTCRMVRGTYNEAETDTRDIHLCDFASACSTWDEKIRYRVWLPRIIDGRLDRGQAATMYF